MKFDYTELNALIESRCARKELDAAIGEKRLARILEGRDFFTASDIYTAVEILKAEPRSIGTLFFHEMEVSA